MAIPTSSIFGAPFGSAPDITAGFGLAGAALDFLGSQEKSKAEADYYSQSQQIAGFEQQINQQRKLQMNLVANRESIENLRNTQKTMAMGKAAAVAGGAQFGSGLAGGQGQERAQGAFNELNIRQNQAIGNAIFGLNDQISNSKILQAQDMTKANTGGGLASLGSSLMSSAGSLGPLLAFA